jgi:hypothetical protein
MTLSIRIRLLYCLRAIFTGAIICLSPILQAATKEEAVKAGSIYNFTKFIVWPNDVSTRNNFYLCVFSKHKPNDGLLALSGKLVADKPIVIRHINKASNINDCQMAFIANDSSKDVQETLNKVTKLPILTVSDSPDFIDKGGMIGLIKDGKRVGFEINIAKTNAFGIHVGAQMLKLAKRVKGLNLSS